MSKSTVLTELDKVFQWKEKQNALFEQKEAELLVQERHICEQLEELNSQLAAVQLEREESWKQRAETDSEELNRARDAVQVGLAKDNNFISERDVFYQELLREREERVTTLINSPTLSKKVQEFAQFQDTQLQFDSLPESYRSVILKHHDEVRAELHPVFTAFSEPLRMLDAEKRNVGLLATLDPPDARPEALALTLPIPFSVYTNLSETVETLHHLLAYRCCAAVSSMLLKVGVPSAPIQFVDYNGMISIRVWLGDYDVVGDVKNTLEKELELISKNSSEFKSVQLGVDVAWVELDVLMTEGE